MNLDSFLEEYNSLKARLADMKDNLGDELSGQIANKMFGGLFQKHPQLVGFLFTGYTPFFNDGEECTYSVYLRDETVAVTKGSLPFVGYELDEDMQTALKQAGIDIDTVETVDLDYELESDWRKRSLLEDESGRYAIRKDVEEAVGAAEEFFKDFMPDHSQFCVLKTPSGVITMFREECQHE